MQLQLIRNATLRLTYAGRKILIDPYLAARHSRPSYTGKSPNPLVELPCTPEAVIEGIELTVISHLHSDHFDPAAQSLLPKDMPIFCQPGDEATIRGKGFVEVTPVQESVTWQGINLIRTPGQHGQGAVLAEMGPVSGFVFRAEGEPAIYWAGDTIWYEAVAEVIGREQPEIIVVHASGAVWGEQGLIVMDAEQTVQLCRAAPSSIVIATHLDSLDHGTISRAELRAYADAAGISPAQLRIPADGESLSF